MRRRRRGVMCGLGGGGGFVAKPVRAALVAGVEWQTSLQTAMMTISEWFGCMLARSILAIEWRP